ncbi:unnamed protein product [Pseudo-nitzschia multistriata]|uniref:[histone H3]-lysine(4) N-trimethyltransferase n=1 Tax=Pseudo-nitzschia multistriata TaxID=183589 RepID=A0A448ZD55_9STRA|nr:unnamed protein product [Pseudo-nitzschia multistriata]
MSSAITENGHNKISKKRKNKYQSPFRIKIGCLVALRYQPRKNNLSVVGGSGSGAGKVSKCDIWEPVATARFSEVWTDPQRGRDDGLALIGSRIRCFFPKAVLKEPYNATSRLLEGTVVNMVHDCEDHAPILIDLLVDNKDNTTLSVRLPFLRRLDDDGKSAVGRVLKESEQRKRLYEEQIKGGKHKAVVRVTLSSLGSSHTTSVTKNPIQAKWVIRKRAPTKIIRRGIPLPVLVKTPTVANNNGENDKIGRNKAGNNVTSIDEEKYIEMSNSGKHGGTNCASNDRKNENEGNPKTPPPMHSLTSKRKKIAIDSTTNTSYNKDFSDPMYLGDGNDSAAQQEGNWRWEAGRYHSPHQVIFASQRPISKELLKLLCYNFVGEVISIKPTQPKKNTFIGTLALVTIRLMVLPEHTRTGRLSHHGPWDLFENNDLDTGLSSQKEKNDNTTQHTNVISPEKQENVVDSDMNSASDIESPCLLQVPIEELVIVHRKIHREFASEKTVNKGTIDEPSSMILRSSYSFLSDTYYLCELEGEGEAEEMKLDMHRCRRCQHHSSVGKRLAGVSHTLCELCFECLKSSPAAKWGTYKDEKQKKYRCDCDFCVDRTNNNLLADLSNKISESESKLDSTLQQLKEYSADRDSGFIATRFVLKSINPVDFMFSPSLLSTFMNSASSKPITKIKARVSKGTKRLTPKKGVRDRARKNSAMSPFSKQKISQFPTMPVSRSEPFRSTCSRLLPYDVQNRKFSVSAADLYEWKAFRSHTPDFSEKPRNLRVFRKRNGERILGKNDSLKKMPQGRAARAQQRRLLRSAAAMGVDVDTLAGRESNVRFDRSNIHGWGVFTDVDIRDGEMIIEYRGELIGNAMAEKREKEYEAAKIGSDYMFRLDDFMVSDATKQGNVARFINASCMPNCYPKIISLDGTKRIVVYAKRDIQAGEELTYDYKFDLEYDPAKRIPCICGAPECRGFLNWDQRYVANDFPEAPAGSNHDKALESTRK